MLASMILIWAGPLWRLHGGLQRRFHFATKALDTRADVHGFVRDPAGCSSGDGQRASTSIVNIVTVTLVVSSMCVTLRCAGGVMSWRGFEQVVPLLCQSLRDGTHFKHRLSDFETGGVISPVASCLRGSGPLMF
uniref:Uncharacterized protein n=1 Tax=Noctiluca scintillans TaxID=2966 RepID=A0A7S1ATR9_NOCSC